MENKLILNRCIHATQVLGVMVIAGIATFEIARNFLASVHLAVLKSLAFSFSQAGIKMHPAEKSGLMPTLANGVIYMIPYAIAYVGANGIKALLPRSNSKWNLSLGRFLIHNLIFCVVVFVFQVVLMAAVIFSGVGQLFQETDGLYWVTSIIVPDSYMDVGRLRFIILALIYNTLMISIPFAVIHCAIYSTKENK